MVWDVTCTILVTVLGSTVFFSASYGIHAYILPYLKRKRRVDYTLPQTERRSNPQLRNSLYSIPSLNYVDPRNSIADTDLRSSRWSTYIQDLDPISISTNIVQSEAKPSAKMRRVKGNSRRHSHERTQATPNTPAIKPRTHKRQTRSQIFRTDTPRQPYVRERSKSDSLISTPRELLASSHSFFMEGNDFSNSPTMSQFSGTTVLPSPEVSTEGHR